MDKDGWCKCTTTKTVLLIGNLLYEKRKNALYLLFFEVRDTTYTDLPILRLEIQLTPIYFLKNKESYES